MAKLTHTNTGVVIEGVGDDVQVANVTRDDARSYFDIEGGSPFGEAFDIALDLAQADAEDSTEDAIVILVIKGEGR